LETSKEGSTTAEPLAQLNVIPVKLLLDRCKISVQQGELQQALYRVKQELPDASPGEQLRQLLNRLQVRGVQTAQLRWFRFDQRQLPALVHYEGQWQLVERGQGGELRLTDGTGNSKSVEEAGLAQAPLLWLKLPLLQENDTSLSGLKENKAAQIVWGELFRERRWVRDIVIATVLINVLAVATSIFAMQVYDRVVPTLAYATLWTLVVGMLLITTIDWLLKTVRARILDSVSCAVDKKVSQQVFEHIMHLRLDSAPNKLGTLAAQVNGLDSVRQFFSSGVIFGLVDLPFALMFIAFIAVIGGVVSLVYLLLLPVALVTGVLAYRHLRLLTKRQLMRSNERQGLLVDAIRGAESIRANNASWRFSEEWRQVTESITGYNIQQKAINSNATVTTGALSTLAYVSAIVVGVGQIEAGNLTMGGLIACSILGGRIIAPVARGVQHMAQWQGVMQSLQMVNQVLNRDTERRPGQTLLMPEQPPQRIELDGIRFAYPESPIQQLNIPHMSFKSGDRVMLLGAVGSGKSTLLKVLAGLYRPSEGRVRLGEADLWETDPNVVANHVAYLPQSVHLFKGTLRSNLSLAGAVSDSLLLKVCRELGIDAIADDNPQGMDLLISEGGEGLSGGQRQLVAMARLLLAQPCVWLLDEPSSSLDSETEVRLLAALEQHIKPDDIVVISTHRPRVLGKLVNRVVLMQHGEVAQDGKPEVVLPQLMKNKAGRAGGAALDGVSHSPLGQGNRGPLNVI
jgi:ATP-binding cassette subfamily C protein LapB